jgi:hypothetical protein
MEFKKINIIKLILYSIVVSSCSFILPSKTGVIKSETYSVRFQDSQWEAVSPDESDLAFNHKKLGSILLANSMCRKYESTSLKNLTFNLFAGVENFKIVTRKPIKFSERDALKSYATGVLDGVKVNFITVTLKKNRCIYDFVLISLAPNKSERDKHFDKFLNSVEIN